VEIFALLFLKKRLQEKQELIININIRSVRPFATLLVEVVGSVKIHCRSGGTFERERGVDPPWSGRSASGACQRAPSAEINQASLIITDESHSMPMMDSTWAENAIRSTMTSSQDPFSRHATQETSTLQRWRSSTPGSLADIWGFPEPTSRSLARALDVRPCRTSSFASLSGPTPVIGFSRWGRGFWCYPSTSPTASVIPRSPDILRDGRALEILKNPERWMDCGDVLRTSNMGSPGWPGSARPHLCCVLQ